MHLLWSVLLVAAGTAVVTTHPQNFPDEIQMAVLNGVGMAKEAIDHGAAVKDARHSEVDIGGAKVGGGYDFGVGFGDSMKPPSASSEEDGRRRRKRSPCKMRASTAAPTAPPAKRRKRQAEEFDFDAQEEEEDVLPMEAPPNPRIVGRRISEAWNRLWDNLTASVQQIKEAFATSFAKGEEVVA